MGLLPRDIFLVSMAYFVRIKNKEKIMDKDTRIVVIGLTITVVIFLLAVFLRLKG